MSATKPPPIARTSRLNVQVSGPTMGELTILKMFGAFGAATRASWDEATALVLAAAAGDVILDLADATFTNDDAVAELEVLRQELAAHGRKLVLINVYDDLRELIGCHPAGHVLLP